MGSGGRAGPQCCPLWALCSGVTGVICASVQVSDQVLVWSLSSLVLDSGLSQDSISGEARTTTPHSFLPKPAFCQQPLGVTVALVTNDRQGRGAVGCRSPSCPCQDGARELWLLYRDGLAQTHTHSSYALRSCGLGQLLGEQALRSINLPRPAVCVAACGMGALAPRDLDARNTGTGF